MMELATTCYLEEIAPALAILKAAAVENRELTVDELLRLQSRYGWDSFESARHLRKLKSRFALMAIAGTDGDREAAAKSVNDSQRILDVRGPEIRSAIEKLQSELSRLESDLTRCQKRFDEMLDAKSQAVTALPKPIDDYFRKQRSEIKSAYHPSVNDAVTELTHCEAVAAIDSSNQESIRLLGSRFITADQKRKGKNIVLPAFFEYQQECLSRIPELRERLDRAQSAFDAALAEHDQRVASFII
jgi:predicted  nucleic acid-binding Zn-ribbon protein